MDNKDILIKNILLSYRNATTTSVTQAITPEELKSYISSAYFLDDILNFSKTGVLIIEYKTFSFIYASSNVKDILGYDAEDFLEGGPDFTMSKAHPEFLKAQLSIHPMMISFFEALPNSEKDRYKFCYTTRYTHKDGHDCMFLHNNIFLKWDEAGKPLVKLILYTDISAYVKDNRSIYYITRISEAGEPEVVLQKSFSELGDITLSQRELEILALTAKGNSSQDIANKLFLSEHTIKSHKKNILKKLGCANTAQMVTLASLYGLIKLPSII